MSCVMAKRLTNGEGYRLPPWSRWPWLFGLADLSQICIDFWNLAGAASGIPMAPQKSKIYAVSIHKDLSLRKEVCPIYTYIYIYIYNYIYNVVKPIINHPHFTRWVVQSLQNWRSMIFMALGESNINNINIHGSSHQSKKLDLVGGLKHLDHFPFSWECHNPNWGTPSFFRGVGQPPTKWWIP